MASEAHTKGGLALPARKRLGIFLLGLLLSSPGVGALGGQEPIRLTESCPECRIEFDTIAVLGDPEGPGMIPGEQNVVAVGPDGRFYVLSVPATFVQLFAPDGRYLGRIGRDGEGPGEFRWPHSLHVDGDGRLRVVDAALLRISVFTPDGEFERAIPFTEGPTPAFDFFPFRGDSILLSGYGFTPDVFGRSVHVLSRDGRRVRSFGAPEHAIVGTDPHRLIRSVSPSMGAGLWVASRDRYLIELWTLEGERVKTLVRETSWFDEIPRADGHPPPPRAFVSRIREDSDGRLWVMLKIPGEEWRDAAEPSLREPHGWRMVDEDLWMNTVVEVIDPEQGTVVASSGRLPNRYSGMVGGPLVAHTRAAVETGEVHVLVMRMRVRRPG